MMSPRLTVCHPDGRRDTRGAETEGARMNLKVETPHGPDALREFVLFQDRVYANRAARWSAPLDLYLRILAGDGPFANEREIRRSGRSTAASRSRAPRPSSTAAISATGARHSGTSSCSRHCPEPRRLSPRSWTRRRSGSRAAVPSPRGPASASWTCPSRWMPTTRSRRASSARTRPTTICS